MKITIVVALALVAAVAAVPVEESIYPKIIRSEYNSEPSGGYSYSFETDDETSQQQTGEVKETVNEENKPVSVVVVRGSFSYTDPEGKKQTINYIADENGYVAEGESIPKLASS